MTPLMVFLEELLRFLFHALSVKHYNSLREVHTCAVIIMQGALFLRKVEDRHFHVEYMIQSKIELIGFSY